jgi:CheY-like chemotaxis protein
VTAILVIDDDMLMGEIFRALLEDVGYQVTVAADGIEGLARLAEARPDLVMVDSQMPGMSGAEVVQRIRTHAPTADVPVLFMSGGTAEDVGALAREAGADNFLVKPFTPGDVFAALAGALESRPSP